MAVSLAAMEEVVGASVPLPFDPQQLSFSKADDFFSEAGLVPLPANPSDVGHPGAQGLPF